MTTGRARALAPALVAVPTAAALAVLSVSSAAAQVVDPTGIVSLTGASGWAGAGLLGLVLWWLAFRFLPDQRDQMTAFIKDKDLQIQALTKIHADESRDANAQHAQEMKDTVTEFTRSVEKQREDFREMLGLTKRPPL